MDKSFASHARRTTSLDRMVVESQNNPPPTRNTNQNRRIITHQQTGAVKKWADANARFKSTNPQNFDYEQRPSDTQISYLKYRKQTWTGNIQRLQAAGLDTTRMVEDQYEFCLPNSFSTVQQLRIHNALHNLPMVKTDADISQIMQLEESTITSPPLPEGSHFYFRSWALTANELRDVISEMAHSDNAHPEILQWKKMVDLLSPKPDSQFDLESGSSIDEDNTDTLPHTLTDNPARYGNDLSWMRKVFPPTYTIRYVGTVEGPRRPIDRFFEDLQSRTSGILPDFLQALERRHPTVYDAGKTYLIKHASILLGEDSDAAADLHRYNKEIRERFLIQMFGYETLLNRAFGGVFTDYVPSYDDDEMYKAMGVKAYSKLLFNASAPNPTVLNQLDAHWDAVQDFANQHSGSTGTSRHTFSNEVRNAALRQSKPYFYRNKVVLLLVVGKDVPLVDYLAEDTFFDGATQAARLARSFLHRLISHESDDDPMPFDSQAFPFVDLWPWLWHQDLQEAMMFLRQYFQIVRPLISLTFSRDVNEIMRGDITDVVDFRMRTFNLAVGVPTIQYYDTANKTDSAFINVPHIHPGRDKYTAQNKELRRLVDLTYQVTLLLQHIASEVVDAHLDATGTLPDRQSLCQEIIKSFNSKKSQLKCRNFFESLDQARDTFVQYVRDHNTTLPTEDVRPVLNAQARHKLTSFGRALGEPRSQSRENQLEAFWTSNLPELHINVPHDDLQKETWKDQFRDLATGQYFLLQVFSQMKPTDFIEKVLKFIRPDLAEDTEWMMESADRKEAVLKCGLWFHRPATTDDGKEKRIVSHFPDQWTSAYDMQGRPVGVHAENGRIVLRYRKANGEKVFARFKCKPAIPSSSEINAIRCVDFTEAGIDVVDGEGNAFRRELRGGELADASMLRGKMAASEGGEELLELWKAVREAHGYNVPDTIIGTGDAEAKDWSHLQKGQGLLSQYAKKEEPKQNRPPKENDALYLLDEFLQRRFPAGGEFRTADPAVVVSSTGDVQAFFRFLEQPEWCNHPYAAEWRKFSSGGGATTGTLKNNLRILRSVNAVRRSRQVVGGSKTDKTNETYFELGPPGSADPNPFNAPTGKAQTKKAQQGGKASSSTSTKKRAAKDDDEEGEGDGVAGDEDGAAPFMKSMASPSKKRKGQGKGSALRGEEMDED